MYATSPIKTLLILAASLAALLPGAATADVVLEWNRVASDVLRDNTSLQNPGMASRSMAMMNLAIYDAFAMTAPGATMFYDYGGGHTSPGYGYSNKAAASQAAHTVLSNLYTDQQAALDAALTSQLALIPDGQAKADGVTLGASIGQSILDRRAGDGYDTMSQYMPTNEPGHWQVDPLNPDQEAWGPDWGNVDTFAVKSNTQFMPAPMPDMTSQQYTDAFNEVKALGSVDSATRTQEQTDIGYFWAYDRLGMGTPHRLFNQALQNVAVQEGNTVKENAELFAKATVAVADAGITAWNSKFEYDFWRPVTGIREADTDGNPDTIADEDWTPLGAPGGEGTDFTPPFPTYLSGHATFGGALFGVLEEFYGTDDITFELTSEELEGAVATRSFDSFSEAMAENGRSRVYLGIHWNFDDTVAQVTGNEIAEYLFENPFIAATVVPEPSALGLLLLGVTAGLAGRRV
ncbi:PAP2 superfamily protein [Planctomycetes bacterium MalM25]|nr:PAP2 superfamily protein [Planctomycetes bacterium MalM25]